MPVPCLCSHPDDEHEHGAVISPYLGQQTARANRCRRPGCGCLRFRASPTPATVAP